MRPELNSATAVYLWAEWSRPSVEALPAVEELAAEFAGRELRFLIVRLGEASGTPRPMLGTALGELFETSGPRSRAYAGAPDELFQRYGIRDLPAVLILSSTGGPARVLDHGGERDPFTLEDLFDSLEAALGGR